MKSLWVSAIVLVLFAGSDLAQEKRNEEDRTSSATLKAAAQIKVGDVNDDRKLTLAEFRKARSAFLKAAIEVRAKNDVERAKRLKEEYRDLLAYQEFFAADVNNDYWVTVDELAAFHALDKANKQWRLSDRDIEALAQGKWNENWESSIVSVDADGDGHISKAEAGDDLKDEKNQKEFDAADLDGDGALSQFEYMKVGIERFRLAVAPRVAKARAEFGDTVCGEPANSLNLYLSYRRKWTHKIYVKNEDGEFTDYTSNEVIDVKADSVTLKIVCLNKDKKPSAGDENGKETVIEFKDRASDSSVSEYIDGGVIKAAGREWRVEVTEYEFGEMKIKSWRSAELPRLVVKAEVHWGEGAKAGKRIVTLEEFSDGE